MMWNLFIFNNHGWNYLGTYSDYDKAKVDMDKIKENSERMVDIRQATQIKSTAHMKALYKIITNEDLEK